MVAFKALFALLSLALVQAVPTPAPEPDAAAAGQISQLLKRQGLAQVISQCTVPNTVALTFVSPVQLLGIELPLLTAHRMMDPIGGRTCQRHQQSY